jgi:hypothetical protein
MLNFLAFSFCMVNMQKRSSKDINQTAANIVAQNKGQPLPVVNAQPNKKLLPSRLDGSAD